MKFTEKAALATSAVSLAAAPMIADANVVQGTGGPVSVSFADLPSGAGFQAVDVPWDVDGANGADFFLYASRVVSTYVSGSGANVEFRYGYNGIANRAYSNAQGNGIGVVANASTTGLARMAVSSRVGLTLAAGQYLITSAAAVATAGYNVQYGTGSYGASSAVPLGGLLPGMNKIGFAFDVNGDTHYGWAEIVLHGGPNFELEVANWWYEDEADAEIHITPVPASGVAALTLLGLGAAGLRAQRRRKAKQ
jgi:MYXO-CTERM domain-containing protein